MQILLDRFITKIVGERGGEAFAKVKGTDLTQATQPFASTIPAMQGLLSNVFNLGGN